MTALNKQALRYGDNVLWFLNELAAYDASDIDGGEFDVYGEDRNGLEGCSTIDVTELAADAAKLIEAAEKRIAELSGEFFALPPLNDDLIAILGRPNFTCAHLAELLRKGGQDMRRKSEFEQAAVIYWFLDLYLKYGDKWESIAKDDIQSRVAAAGIGVKEE